MTTVVASLFVVALSSADAPPAERVKKVRAMYEKLPADILEITEPAKMLKVQVFRDGGTITVTLTDAKDKELSVRLDRKIGTKTRDDLFLAGKHLPHRGPEESAVYGLLLRTVAKPPDNIPKMDIETIEALLQVLDARFAGAMPGDEKAGEK
jgi:hypothetical protein